MTTWIGCAAANFRKGRKGHRPEAIVIHIIVGSLRSADNSFLAPRHGASAHYGVGRNGDLHQYVEETDTAFHAGVVVRPTWNLIRPGRDAATHLNPNLYTVGIEHEGHPDQDWPPAEYLASARLIADIANRWAIPIDKDHLPFHRQIRASKTCPGVVNHERLVELAQAEGRVLAPVTGGTRRVRVLSLANLRSGVPSTSAPVIRKLTPGVDITCMGFTNDGESVKGNRCWYRIAPDRYLWAGVTDQPHPE